MALLEISNLSKYYKKRTIDVKALEDVSFAVQEGEFVSIVGRSGSGKSTLLNLIGGLDTPDKGEIAFKNIILNKMNKSELELHRRYSVGMIFQSFNLIPYKTALDNVVLPQIFSGISKSKRKMLAEELLHSVGLGDRMNHVPPEMSGGESQRVAIARALANSPQMLLADEPTGNLDTSTASQIMNILKDLNKNRKITVLMITHEQDIARNYSDRIITLSDGMVESVESIDNSGMEPDNETV